MGTDDVVGTDPQWLLDARRSLPKCVRPPTVIAKRLPTRLCPHQSRCSSCDVYRCQCATHTHLIHSGVSSLGAFNTRRASRLIPVTMLSTQFPVSMTACPSTLLDARRASRLVLADVSERTVKTYNLGYWTCSQTHSFREKNFQGPNIVCGMVRVVLD